LSSPPDGADAHFRQGVAFQQQGRLDAAITCYRQAVEARPGFADAHQNLGAVLLQQGRLDDAIACYRRVLSLKPEVAEAHGNLGAALYLQGKAEDASDCLRQAVHLKPDYAEAHNNLGVALQRLGRLDEALPCFREAVRIKPDYAEAHNNLGVAFQKHKESEKALSCYDVALRLNPNYAEAHNNRGAALQALKRLEEAVTCYRRAVQLKPDYAEAHNNQGSALYLRGKAEEAIACFRRAILIKPEYAEPHMNLGAALQRQGDMAEARACLQQALRLEPQSPEAHNSLGILLQEQGQLDEARACFEEALRLQPTFAEGHVAHAFALLLAGEFERGWRDYEWRWRCQDFPTPPLRSSQPAWDGSPLEGRTILLRAEQGLGDTIQFIRYVPLVRQRGGRVIVECPPALHSLVKTCPGVEEVFAPGTTLPYFDVHSTLMSLPFVFGTTLATIPADVPYLGADPALVEQWRTKLSGVPQLKVGVVWQGSTDHKGDHLRSIPLRSFAPLARRDEVHLFSLQLGPGREQLVSLGNHFCMTDLGSWFDTNSFKDLAAVLKNLDLVVTVDTAPAHLAGALGVPVWMALPFAPEWRWLRDREDSPWYPGMRLFRQSRPRCWEDVMERMAGELDKRL
jgi:tetratricopeptide (TPR) repeat protein